MPVILLAIPAAIGLAWIALKSGTPRTGGAPATDAGGHGLAPGATGELAESDAGEEEPFKRHPLQRRRLTGGEDDPETNGNEVGGPYGPGTQEQAPSGVEGFAELPPATQTYVLAGGQTAAALFGAGPTTAQTTYQGPAVNPTGGRTSPVYIPPSVFGPAPAPTLSPAGTYSVGGGSAKAV